MPDRTDHRPDHDGDLLAQVVDRLDRAGDTEGATWLRAEIADRAADPDRAPIPFALTSHGYDATRPDIAPADERGLTGAEGPSLSSGPTLSSEKAAEELARSGCSVDDARAAVRRYQDATSARLGTSVHAWGLDAADLDAIRAEQAAGLSAPVIPLPRTGAENIARSGRGLGDPGEAARRDQLARWHTADTAAGDLVDAGPVRDRGEDA